LHTGNPDWKSLTKLAKSHVADPDTADLSFVTQCHHLGQLAVKIDGIAVPVVESEIHHVELVDPKAA
jgi:hypothetical protein